MSELSANLKAKVEKLQAQQKSTLAELEESRDNEIEALTRRLEKAQRDREEANRKLGEYVEMYQHLDKHFKNPAEGSIFKERGESSLYETLATLKQSVINIF
jgi:predicted  nucleic acid-binding Zn-ribbon protein